MTMTATMAPNALPVSANAEGGEVPDSSIHT
jgi:hypothetical protein